MSLVFCLQKRILTNIHSISDQQNTIWNFHSNCLISKQLGNKMEVFFQTERGAEALTSQTHSFLVHQWEQCSGTDDELWLQVLGSTESHAPVVQTNKLSATHKVLKVICNGFSQNWWKVVSSCLLRYKQVCVINFDKLRSKMLKSRSLVVSLV